MIVEGSSDRKSILRFQFQNLVVNECQRKAGYIAHVGGIHESPLNAQSFIVSDDFPVGAWISHMPECLTGGNLKQAYDILDELTEIREQEQYPVRTALGKALRSLPF